MQVIDKHAFEIELPYTVVKGQKAWANGVELGLYSIQVDKQPPVNFCLASDEQQVAAWLERELSGGLRAPGMPFSVTTDTYPAAFKPAATGNFSPTPAVMPT